MLFTSEQVSGGHPDKIADQISDAIVTDCMSNDLHSRVAVETLIKDNHVIVGGEITSNAVSAGFGGGVFVRGTMEVSGTVKVSGNSKKNGSADNVRLAANQDIHVTGALSGSIGVNKALKPEQGSPVTVSAGLSGNGTAAIFSSDDKTYTIILTDAGEVLLSVYCPKDKTCPMSAYTDLKPTEWYHDGIHFVLQSGFMSGYSTKLFGPGDNTTRAMVATIIWNMAGKPKAEGKTWQ